MFRFLKHFIFLFLFEVILSGINAHLAWGNTIDGKNNWIIKTIAGGGTNNYHIFAKNAKFSLLGGLAASDKNIFFATLNKYTGAEGSR